MGILLPCWEEYKLICLEANFLHHSIPVKIYTTEVLIQVFYDVYKVIHCPLLVKTDTQEETT